MNWATPFASFFVCAEEKKGDEKRAGRHRRSSASKKEPPTKHERARDNEIKKRGATMATAKRSNAGDLRRFLVAKRAKTGDAHEDHNKETVSSTQGRGPVPATAAPLCASSDVPHSNGPTNGQRDQQPTATTRPTRVVRLRRRGGHIVQDCDVYIGRRWTAGGWDLPQSEWANPYTVRQVGSAAEAVRLYEHEHLARQPDLVAKVASLKGLVLGCWCKNRPDDPCHGDVLARLADAASHTPANEEETTAPETCTPRPPHGDGV
ncbi:hypothetical protein pclt_cds_913 [Pandoravirus celtis]|uniref:DUF4326 domain-containing protein n=1 Tax=Pandoravirus celtis TaxID=2568002 RepID=A0A4D6EK13_9VIRU|nr:hypothetical protein pclt_cds_913 [Pandoravirus celtis]